MKKFMFLITILTALSMQTLESQPPQAFSYQAAIQNASNQPLANTTVTIQISILQGSIAGPVVYSETHTTTTNAQGIVSLTVGTGNPKSGNFTTIPWSRNQMFIKVDVDLSGNGNFIPMGVSQILSVPYALTAGNGLDTEPGTEGQTLVHNGDRWQASSTILATETGVVINSSDKRNKGQAIFAVRNALGDTIFAVYEDGVKIMIDDSPTKSTKGSFAVGGLSSTKEPGTEYLKVTPDSSYIQFNTDTRTTKGGFAVGGLSSGKAMVTPYFTLLPSLINFNFDMEAVKRSGKGGFAVGGLSSGKNIVQNYFTLNQDSIRLYIETEEKTTKGGFAVGGLSSGKPVTDKYLSLTPGFIQFNFDESLISKTTKGGFAVGGLSSGKSSLFNYFHLKPDSATIVLKDKPLKGGKGSFSISNFDSAQTISNLFSIDKDCTFIATKVHAQGDMLIQGNITTTGSILNLVSDIDGNLYSTVRIVNQEWFTQNLRTTKYSDGTPIFDTLYQTPLYYNIAPDSVEVYGFLYYSLVFYYDNKNICPTGWRVPSYADWYTLFSNVSDLYSDDQTALLSEMFFWPTLDMNGTNASHFGAVPSGYVLWNTNENPSTANVYAHHFYGYYWGIDIAYNMVYGFQLPGESLITPAQQPYSSGYAVRCIKN